MECKIWNVELHKPSQERLLRLRKPCMSWPVKQHQQCSKLPNLHSRQFQHWKTRPELHLDELKLP